MYLLETMTVSKCGLDVPYLFQPFLGENPIGNATYTSKDSGWWPERGYGSRYAHPYPDWGYQCTWWLCLPVRTSSKIWKFVRAIYPWEGGNLQSEAYKIRQPYYPYNR